MLQVVVVAILAVAAHAQSRDDCCAPMQWEGYEERVVGAAMGEHNDAMVVRAMIILNRIPYMCRMSSFSFPRL